MWMCNFEFCHIGGRPIENLNQAGVECPKCSGASWRGRDGSGILTCSRALVKMRTCEHEMDRVQHPQGAVEAVVVLTCADYVCADCPL